MNYKISANDSPLIERAKRECNYLLQGNHPDNPEIAKKVFNVINFIDNDEIQLEHYLIVSKYVNDIINNKIICPLTLKEDEFDKDQLNLRCNALWRRKDGKICYFDAYDCTIIHEYDNVTKKEIVSNSIKNRRYTGVRIYINAGGVFTGQYIEFCFLRQETIDKGCYMPKDSVHIPVSVIHTPEYDYFTMDKREPKFKALCEFYDVEIQYNEEMKSKFDIRKYEKLSKKTSKK